MKLKISSSQIQKQVLSPIMQLSIGVLMLPIGELNAAIEEEILENPMLEVDESKNDPAENIDDELREKLEALAQESTLPYYYEQSGDDEISEDRPIRCDETLEEILLKQLRIELSDPLLLSIGELILGNLNEDGYLTISIDEIKSILNYNETAIIEHVLKIIQKFEPFGIATRNLEECLLIQAQEKLKGEHPIVNLIIEAHLIELGQRKYHEIARKLNLTVEDIKKAARLIATLDPKPARNFRPISANIYIKPDVIINKRGDRYQIQLNDEGVPHLRINPLYKGLLKQNNLNQKEKEYVREKIKNGLLFMKSIQQRGSTIKGITEYILEKQGDFFELGYSALVPMSLKDVAKHLERSESTISRAIHDKYIETPRGLYSLKFFFSQAVGQLPLDQSASPQNGNGRVSNRSIKEEIRTLIDSEDKTTPLSDQAIQIHFEKQRIKIARRTISKYRQSLKILPSHLRKDEI